MSIRCMFGFHDWKYYTIYYRWFYKKCSRCGKRERIDKKEFYDKLYMYKLESK